MSGAGPRFWSPGVRLALAGLVVLGGMQDWWLQPLVAQMSASTLFVGTAALTAIADNAALTYLGTLIQGLSDEAKYGLVAGAVTGGGLTVIANAPNPAGVALLRRGFADQSIGAAGLPQLFSFYFPLPNPGAPATDPANLAGLSKIFGNSGMATRTTEYRIDRGGVIAQVHERISHGAVDQPGRGREVGIDPLERLESFGGHPLLDQEQPERVGGARLLQAPQRFEGFTHGLDQGIGPRCRLHPGRCAHEQRIVQVMPQLAEPDAHRRL